MKKIFMLTLTLAVVAATVLGISAYAASFTPRTSAPSSSSSYWYNQKNNPYKGSYTGECTWYVWGRAYEITGTRPTYTPGSGGAIWSNCKKAGYSTGSTPRVGAIMCTSGHVAIVEKISGNTMTISEYNWNVKHGFSTATLSVSSSTAGGYRGSQKIYGYVYLTSAAASSSQSTSQPSTVSSAVVSKVLFDADYYRTKYPDLNAAFGSDYNKLYNHWLTHGKREGRSPSPFYDYSYYRSMYSDLRNAFGNNAASYYDHWVNYGIKEIRASSKIYNGTYYKNKYSDLRKAFGNDGAAYINHFYSYGMSEGRQANSTFNLSVYKKYSDLSRAFGSNNKAYYYHYMQYGISEGRVAK